MLTNQYYQEFILPQHASSSQLTSAASCNPCWWNQAINIKPEIWIYYNPSNARILNYQVSDVLLARLKFNLRNSQLYSCNFFEAAFCHPAQAGFDLIVGLIDTFYQHSSTHHVFSIDPWPTMYGFSLGLKPRITDNSDLCWHTHWRTNHPWTIQISFPSLKTSAWEISSTQKCLKAAVLLPMSWMIWMRWWRPRLLLTSFTSCTTTACRPSRATKPIRTPESGQAMSINLISASHETTMVIWLWIFLVHRENHDSTSIHLSLLSR